MKPADLHLHPYSISTLLLWKHTPTAVITAVVRDTTIQFAELKDDSPHDFSLPVLAVQELLDQGYLTARVSTEVKPGLRDTTYVLSGAGRVIVGALEDESDKEELGDDD